MEGKKTQGYSTMLFIWAAVKGRSCSNFLLFKVLRQCTVDMLENSLGESCCVALNQRGKKI